MAKVYLDRVTTLEFVEDRGVITRLVREARVTGLTNTDPRILNEALAELGLAPGSSLTGYPDLTLVGRRPSLVRGQKSKVDVRLVYEREDTDARFIGDATVAQVRRAYDASGDAITVSYVFPDDYPAEEFRGLTIDQPGVVTTTKALMTLDATIVVETNTPDSFKRDWINHVNSSPWGGGDARTWHCARVRSEEFDLSGPVDKYRMNFRFVHDPDGHENLAVFIDPNTNRPPPGIEPDILTNPGSYPEGIRNAVKRPLMLPSRNFGTFPGEPQ